MKRAGQSRDDSMGRWQGSNPTHTQLVGTISSARRALAADAATQAQEPQAGHTGPPAEGQHGGPEAARTPRIGGPRAGPSRTLSQRGSWPPGSHPMANIFFAIVATLGGNRGHTFFSFTIDRSFSLADHYSTRILHRQRLLFVFSKMFQASPVQIKITKF